MLKDGLYLDLVHEKAPKEYVEKMTSYKLSKTYQCTEKNSLLKRQQQKKARKLSVAMLALMQINISIKLIVHLSI